MNRATTAEIMLALRSPSSGWLGVLACALEEARHDPSFDQHQRDLAMQLLGADHLPDALMEAARQRATSFETELDEAASIMAEPDAVTRPKLTLVGH